MRSILLSTILLAGIGLPLSGCAVAAGQQATSICVPRLIQARVDVVLRNLLTECGMEDGRWRHDMGPGCTMIEAAVFGYRVGVRRSRQDLIGIGERTAAAEAAAVSRIMPNLLRGGTDGCWAAIHGLPALFLSGKYSGNARHGQLFGTAFAPLRLAARLDHRREVMWAGVAAAFAQLYGDSGRRDPSLLDDARIFAARAEGGVRGIGPLAAMAWAAVARASGAKEDLQHARQAVEATLPSGLRVEEAQPDLPYWDVLSLHLALTHALLDLHETDGETRWRSCADGLLRYVFSDALFDGRYLMHHRNKDGHRSERFCSGCNFLALYLADRPYGDALRFDPVPEPKVLSP